MRNARVTPSFKSTDWIKYIRFLLCSLLHLTVFSQIVDPSLVSLYYLIRFARGKKRLLIEGGPGVDGPQGVTGPSGRPGKDAHYCPCPPKSDASPITSVPQV